MPDGAELKVGDKVKVRIELKADRDMEYVHMKDMRAPAMEPVNVLSSYHKVAGGGLGLRIHQFGCQHQLLFRLVAPWVVCIRVYAFCHPGGEFQQRHHNHPVYVRSRIHGAQAKASG